MEEQETATKVEVANEKSTEETIKDKSPTTPSNSGNWWGSWISQAKEKVELKVNLNMVHFLRWILIIINFELNREIPCINLKVRRAS